MALMLVLLAAASHALQAPRRVARHATLRMATEIVQFTTDLRVEDHGGLSAAANADAWLPVYCGEDADDARVARELCASSTPNLGRNTTRRCASSSGKPDKNCRRRIKHERGRRPRLRRRPHISDGGPGRGPGRYAQDLDGAAAGRDN